MAEKKAYELGVASVGFVGKEPLGDAIIYKKAFEAITAVEPTVKIDILCMSQRSFINSRAFYIDSPNLNLITGFSNDEIQKYDLTILTEGGLMMLHVNGERLKQFSPALLQSVVAMHDYNTRNLYSKDFNSRYLFNMARARVLRLDCFRMLSCGGALPIYDNKVNIPLLPEWRAEFEKLGLRKYITLGSNGGNFNRHMVKEWPTRYFVDFIALMKSKMPDITVVQTGGGGVQKFENADRHLIGTDLELFKHILKNSLLHVDCEGGPVHLATQLGTKCVVLFGATDVRYYGYGQNINLCSDVCSPCYFAWDRDSECLLGGREPLCMLALTPQKVFDAAYRYLKSFE